MFHDANSKLSRAESLIDELLRDFTHFAQTATVDFQLDVDASHTNLNVRVNGALPAQMANITGDAIHNLRSSLDLLVCESLRMSTGTDRRGGFAFGDNRAAFLAEFKKKQLHKLNSTLSNYLKDELRPYKDGNYLLWALHQMDIGDKHRAINPVAKATVLRNIDLYDRVNNNKITFTQLNLTGEVVDFHAATITGNASLNVRGPNEVNLQFGKNDYLAGKDVFATLNEFKCQVQGVISRFTQIASK